MASEATCLPKSRLGAKTKLGSSSGLTEVKHQQKVVIHELFAFTGEISNTSLNEGIIFYRFLSLCSCGVGWKIKTEKIREILLDFTRVFVGVE